ncbi:2-octaprenyl-6-methoxyphenol 4-monooxygenase [Cyanobium sp. Copco_Reservoir_LC18]|uniref:FAD-dependent monooxygenase n=1 Tax=Cyanobium sp. Copco_Reservoir_LC18 TaxID=1328305 RepID=UPI00135AEAF1|nr:FAD-dependent monooxygenase [Cyanobium sp. Copco_Reservoir_LC18]KAF0653371.1 2-octaprenyl-6-methoxyphenol 4-monooxygenase [Cyanobium sp. Copco_Reservoir_LC18]
MPASLHARIRGAGPTGALAALALAQAGWRVSLHDPLAPEALQARERAYAFTHSSRELLQRLGLWGDLRPTLVPFRRLHLRDVAAGRDVRFAPTDLGQADAVGWIGSHRPLMALLLRRLGQHPAVRLELGGATPSAAANDPDDADLLVAADGPDSPTRQAAGIHQWSHPYRQACLTVQVEMRGCADDEAWELLRPEGPFAVLPLGGRRFQLVWSAPAARCRQLEALDAPAFLDRLAGALPDRLQPDALLTPPRAFPVALQLARRLHRGRTVLVGESAHRCHPVGGQGLNLCWRDVAVLQRLAERAARGTLSPRRIGAAYGRRRWPDLLLTLLATDLLVRTFSNRHRWLLPLRRLALACLARVDGTRALALRAMTQGPCRLRRPLAAWGDGDQQLSPAPALSGHGALPAPSARPE